MTEQKPSLLTRALGVFSDVREGEGPVVLALLVNLFLILVAYYVIKTVREPLILASGGAELKSYAAAGQAAVLIGAVPLYSWFASRVDRMRLIWGMSLFFVACIEGFYVAAKLGIPHLGIFFYIWVGIFSLAIIAQFWSFANDLYTQEKGKRLFPVVAIGATCGGMVGAKLAQTLFTMGVGAYEVLQVSAAILLVHGFIYSWINSKIQTKAAGQSEEKTPDVLAEGSGFALVFKSPYLRLLALLLILLNVVNTTGEYILGASVIQAAEAAILLAPSIDMGAYIGAFYGGYFFWVNLGTILIQALLVSRMVKYLGMAGVLFALPIVAFGAYGLIAAGVGLSVMKFAKVAENMTDYSVMNTAKAMLWLPTSREEKYKAKQAIDTFFVRLGDVASAGLVFVGTDLLGLGLRSFALFNMVVVVAWGGIAWMVWRMYKTLSPPEETA